MNRLLNRSLKSFIIYALIVLAASIPAYYYLVDSIWLRELDEHNEIIAERTKNELIQLDFNEKEITQSIFLWNKIQPGTNIRRIFPYEERRDCTYTILRTNPYASNGAIDRFRGLSRIIRINGNDYVLTVETNVEETEETVFAIAITTFFFYLILVIGFLVISKRLSVKLWRPFKSTLSKLKAFNLNTETGVAFEKTNIIEFQELNEALNKLIDHTIAVYKSQKEFTENASHELQTPLAIIKGKLDLLLQKQNLEDSHYQIIEDVNIAITRVSRINKNLLLLAKIENNQFADNATLCINEITIECIEVLKEHFSNKQLQLKIAIEDNCFVNGNGILIEILINNLLLNAIRYTNHGGTVEVALSQLEMTFSNSGLKALENEYLFKRFRKLKAENTGSGLGLSIVEQICIRHQWKIEYAFHHEMHIFKIIF